MDFLNLIVRIHMRYFIVIAYFLITNQLSTFGQVDKFDELSDKMFFNIFINKPDSSVFDFVKKYFPAFTEELKPGMLTVASA